MSSSTVDFTKYLDKKLDDIEAPKPAPAGTYPALLGAYKVDVNKNGNVFVQYTALLTGGPQESDAQEAFSSAHIDLSKKKLNVDFYLTDDADWRFKKFAQSCGHDTSGMSIRELIPLLINAPVLISLGVQPSTNQVDENGVPIMYNRVNDVVGVR